MAAENVPEHSKTVKSEEARRFFLTRYYANHNAPMRRVAAVETTPQNPCGATKSAVMCHHCIRMWLYLSLLHSLAE